MKRKIIILLVGAALLLATAAGLWWWTRADTSSLTYRAVSATRGRLEVTVQSTGTVQPLNRLEIKPPLAGRAEQVLVREGQVVKKGQVLLWMSSNERAALIDAARARGPEEVRRWEEFYRATPVIAPIDGTIILRNIEPGQSFTANDAVLVIADRLQVEAQVDETDIAQRPRRSATSRPTRWTWCRSGYRR
jgi:macrolide-specific efflux system membrane fusion protein